MAHPVVWSKKIYFYPTGNTPATSLTQNLAPEEDAKILVLGCGDARSVLYTIHADQRVGDFIRPLDFTFCDHEAAVLARNILLYTLLIDGNTDDAKLWNFYFHVFIDPSSLALLQSQSRKLLGLSQSLESWSSSPYGSIIKICTLDTLTNVRVFWSKYTMSDLTPAQQTQLKDKFSKAMKDNSMGRFQPGTRNLSATRSAGPLAPMILEMGAEHFKHYWKTGLAAVPNSPLAIREATQVNPSFVYSGAGDVFNVHYGTDPILCFHLAAALAPIEGDANTPVKEGDLEGLVAAIQGQFKAWCRSFMDRASKGNLTMRFFTGDALSFCKALQYRSETGHLSTPEYARIWGGATINFTSDYEATNTTRAPLRFNVIESSNLADHVEMLNLLLVASPLLIRSHTSVLHTNTLVSSNDGQSPALNKMVLDLPLVSTIIGLVPERHLSESTFHSFDSEMMMSLLTADSTGPKQLHESNIWRVPYALQPPTLRHGLSIPEADLAHILFNAYLKMFSDESPNDLVKSLTGLRGNSGGRPTTRVLSLLHHTRESFARLFSSIQSIYTGGIWNTVLNKFIGLVQSDRTLIVGMNNFQDLTCHFELLGVDAEGRFIPSPSEITSIQGDTSLSWNFGRWSGPVPKIVCVVLVVPRAKLRVAEGIDITPTLHCETAVGEVVNNMHSGFQPVFGRIEVLNSNNSPDQRRVVIHEDPKGWSGSSDLICHFYAPAHIFVQGPPEQTEISLHIRNSMAAVGAGVTRLLGPLMCIFKTTLADGRRAMLVKERPRIVEEHRRFGEVARPIGLGAVVRDGEKKDAVFKFTGGVTSSIVMRWNVEDEGAKELLRDRKTEVYTNVESNTAVHVGFNGHEEGDERWFGTELYFPFPVNVGSLSTRIARKSSYIEVEGRIIYEPNTDPEHTLFPVIYDKSDGLVKSLNMHHLNLSSLPKLQAPLTPTPTALRSMLNNHLGLTLSSTERRSKTLPAGQRTGLFHLKESIANIFMLVLWDNKNQPSAFSLTSSEDGHWAFIFVDSVRLDVVGNTLVADACIFPLTMEIMTKHTGLFFDTMQKFQSSIRQLTTPESEVECWKRVLPSLVERGRTWQHKPSCEYKPGQGEFGGGGQVPRSTMLGFNPICSCGEGVDLGGFGVNGEESKKWKPFGRWVTRMALASPFPASMLGRELGEFREALRKGGPGELERVGERPSASAPAVSQSTSATKTSVKKNGLADKCSSCGGPGKPKLSVCSGCKKAVYCSRECQAKEWKKHKAVCSKASK
ncbi:hypothetical protein CC2G_010040 [Coprinopsis cinerea AmutBmut pab1-1]|nr:hypothetical protein CC2G_010040 [Coprinopsis cinerea AmutBmut pab1-1]